jgi:serine/threonine-protein kinase RsbW
MAVGGSKRRANAGSGRPKGRLQFVFSSVGEVHDILGEILRAAEQHGFAGESFFAIRIAAEEALINAVKHGNQMDPRKKVHVEAKFNDLKAEIVIEDEGVGFDRTSVPDPTADDNLHKSSGRGILLIEAYMHDVKWDRDRRRVRMVRQK